MITRRAITLLLTLAALIGAFAPSPCDARTLLRNICRVKGQEENTLRGLGLVVGLAGTGEANDPATMRALARAMEVMGAPIPELAIGGNQGLRELEKVKNVALVWVTAHVPATGARRGDKLDCYVSGINGKSLSGGRLAFAALQGPNTLDKTFYALCEGAVFLEDPAKPLAGIVPGGCQMEQDVFTPYMHNGEITLVLEKHHAYFGTAVEIAETIRGQYASLNEDLVQVIDAANIVVRVPVEYETDPAGFVAELLELNVYSAEPEARVVINQRTGAIVISGDVTIGDVIVSHKNVIVEAAQPPAFTSIDADESDTAKLAALVDALNSIKVPNADVIEIIKGIDRNGKLHGRLVIE